MRRQSYDMYAVPRTPRYIVLEDMLHKVLECEKFPPGADLRAAMAAAVGRLRRDGWNIESDADYGFVFVNRGGERRLLMLTERDPADTTPQSFNPFR